MAEEGVAAEMGDGASVPDHLDLRRQLGRREEEVARAYVISYIILTCSILYYTILYYTILYYIMLCYMFVCCVGLYLYYIVVYVIIKYLSLLLSLSLSL